MWLYSFAHEEQDVFRNAQCVKVNPYSPHNQVTFLILSGQIDALSFLSRVGESFVINLLIWLLSFTV